MTISSCLVTMVKLSLESLQLDLEGRLLWLFKSRFNNKQMLISILHLFKSALSIRD